ncbi:PPK2 family polyphosphate kinase [Demequina sp. SO4-13]|uniref:PPK2 family polyphosphate kinase n=1 Tax=Demequina sp. SO4-13 TaxID=3401027 RepID=UPI003AF82BEB
MAASHHWDEHPTSALRVSEGFRIEGFDPTGKPGFAGSKQDGKRIRKHRGEHLAELQERLFAGGRVGDDRSLLLVLQGMDTAGKGGIVRHVLGMVDPQGVQARGFGAPTEEELEHHFLWRIEKALPKAGHIGVFDRSHYEDVLIARVHELVPRGTWEGRYDEINEWERRLTESGTTIVKCALMVSQEEQLDRLEKRLNRPDKHWKYSPADLDERAHWPAYMEAFQAVFDRTSTAAAPWHVIPSTRKWYARLAVTELLTSALEKMDLQWPAADYDLDEERARITQVRRSGG